MPLNSCLSSATIESSHVAIRKLTVSLSNSYFSFQTPMSCGRLVYFSNFRIFVIYFEQYCYLEKFHPLLVRQTYFAIGFRQPRFQVSRRGLPPSPVRDHLLEHALRAPQLHRDALPLVGSLSHEFLDGRRFPILYTALVFILFHDVLHVYKRFVKLLKYVVAYNEIVVLFEQLQNVLLTTVLDGPCF